MLEQTKEWFNNLVPTCLRILAIIRVLLLTFLSKEMANEKYYLINVPECTSGAKRADLFWHKPR